MIRTRLVAPNGRGLSVPLKIRPNYAAGQNGMIEDLRLSPFTHVMVTGPQAALNFGMDAALARIGDLSRRQVSQDDPDCPALTYHHLIMARHELIWTCGIWVESTPPDTAALLKVFSQLRARSDVFCESSDARRMCLLTKEAYLLRNLLLPEESLLTLIAA